VDLQVYRDDLLNERRVLSAPPSNIADKARQARLRRFFRFGLAAQLVLVTLIAVGAYLRVLPSSLPSFPNFDKIAHGVLIGLLAFFLDGALDFRPLVRGWRFPRLGPVLVLVVAGIEEYAQRFAAHRGSSIVDFAADFVGVCFFSWLAHRIAARRG
jgi:VanZ family protein